MKVKINKLLKIQKNISTSQLLNHLICGDNIQYNFWASIPQSKLNTQVKLELPNSQQSLSLSPSKMNLSVLPQIPSLQNLPSLDTNLPDEFYPSQELLDEFQKCDKLFSEYEFTKTTLKSNQLMKRFKVSPEDSISMKKLTAFSYFQCNFFYKSITIFVDLVKSFNDTEARVYLSLFERSACLSNLVQDIKQFKGLNQQSLQDLAAPSSQYCEEDSGNCSTNTSFQSIDSPLMSPAFQNHGCSHIFKPDTSYSLLHKLNTIIQKTKNILEVEQDLIDFVETLKNCNMIQIVLMVLVLEHFNMKETKKAVDILTILLNRFPNNPKYKTCLAQIYVQFGDLRNFEIALKNMQNIVLTDFKQNILFGVQGLFVRNHPQFDPIYLQFIAQYLPLLFLEENKSAFTVQTLQNIFPYYRSNLLEMAKIAVYNKFISDELMYSPNNIYIDLYFN